MPSPLSPALHNNHPQVIYAKWQERLAAKDPKSHAPPYIDRYHVVIPPHTPLAVGQRIKIHALSPTSYHSPEDRPLAYPTVYDTYDPKISGRLVRVRAMTESTVEFVLDNETPNAAVVLAYIAIHHIPGFSTKLDDVERVCKWATDNEPDLRFIPLETAVIVLSPMATRLLIAQTGDQNRDVPARPGPTAQAEDADHRLARTTLDHAETEEETESWMGRRTPLSENTGPAEGRSK